MEVRMSATYCVLCFMAEQMIVSSTKLGVVAKSKRRQAKMSKTVPERSQGLRRDKEENKQRLSQ